MILQEDGSLVLYSRGIVLWSSRTNGRAVNYAIMQTDGNFVLYRYPNPVWATDTNGWGNAFPVVQDVVMSLFMVQKQHGQRVPIDFTATINPLDSQSCHAGTN